MHKVTLPRIRREHLKRETEFLLILNNAIRTKNEKKIDNMQEITSVGYMKRDETVDIIINECNKMTQKEYRNKHKGKLVDWELCKSLKFNHTNKWYMNKRESVLEN